MTEIKHIGLFISSPSDVKNEIDSIRVIIDEINKTSGRQGGYHIETLNWIVDTYTDIGKDPQDVINKQIDDKYDLLVAVFCQRIGSPTIREESGTVEEIKRALSMKKQILIYFNTQPPENIYQIDLNQLQKLAEYKKSLSQNGILFKEYNGLDSFESLFRIQVNNLISEKILSNADKKESNVHKVNEDYSAISSLINSVDEQSQELEIDIFQMIAQLLSNLESITSSMNAMGVATRDLTDRLNKRTEEMNRFIHIKDNMLRLQKLHVIADLLAGELDEYNNRINNELPVFSENLLPIGPAYSLINQYALKYNVTEATELQEAVSGFRGSLEELMHKSAFVLTVVMKWPPATSKFNKAKRGTEVALKNITKELLTGLKLVNEALDHHSSLKES